MHQSVNNKKEIPLTLWTVLSKEWLIWLPGSILVFLVASVVLSGWPDGLIPNITYPYGYSGDGLLNSWWIQRIIEGGWYFNNNRSGYPFGSSFFDFPGSDAGSVLVLKFIGFFAKTFPATLNLYFLSGFSIVFISGYGVLRTFDLKIPISILGATLFTLLPFHFLRLGHLYYTWYFSIPLFFYFSYRLISKNSPLFGEKSVIANCFLYLLVFIALASFGVYYALFGVMVLTIGTVMGFIEKRNKKIFLYGGLASAAVVLGVLLNLAPNIAYTVQHGKNSEMARRSPAESELYGLKLTQLILPRSEHRYDKFNQLTQAYDEHFPLVNENSFAALGVIGALGIFLILASIFICLSNRKIDKRISFFSLAFLVLFMVATIGGLSSLFALLITPLIRGWNRVSVFIGFAAQAVFLLYIQYAINSFSSKKFTRIWLFLLAAGLTSFGVWDQTSAPCLSCQASIKSHFLADQKFISGIEDSLPVGSAIYQLPYMPFPETPPLYKLGTYDLTIGYLHSKNLRWSYAGTKGREGDLFYRYLALEPIESQIKIIKRLGFSGIYVDRRGYADNGKAIEADIRAALNESPTLVHPAGTSVFYRFASTGPIIKKDLDPRELMKIAGFSVDKNGVHYQATLAEGIDFRKPGLPAFVSSIAGLSKPEFWGRWSDARLNETVRIQLADKLPNTFTLLLKAHGFGPNVGSPTIIHIGNQEASIRLTSKVAEYKVEFKNIAPSARMITITPPNPMSPAQLHQSSDERMLGIGIQKIRFEDSPSH